MTAENQVKEENTAYRVRRWWEYYPLHKWWCNDHCPIVPRLYTRKADKYNPSSFGFHWLVFHVWSMDHFSFGVDAEVSGSRIMFGFILPYLRVCIGFMDLYQFTRNIDNFLTRKPKQEQE